MIVREELEALWLTKITNAELAERFGVTGHGLSRAKREFGLPDRPNERGKRQDDPEEDEIKRLCAEVQATWTPEERERRQVGGPGRWRPPNFTINTKSHAVPAAVLR